LSMGVALGMGMGFLFLGLCLGYLCGRRKAIVDMLKNAAKDAALKKTLQQAGDDMANEEENEEDAAKGEAKEMLDLFLSMDSVPGLDDNAGVTVNPILLYDIKKREEQKRLEKLIKQLLSDKAAEGQFDEAYLASLSDDERQKLGEKIMREQGTKNHASVGSVPGFTREHGASQNSMAILVAQGLRLAAAKEASAQDADTKAAQQIREQMRTIDKHLSTDREIDISREPVKKGSNLRVANALQMAKLTKVEPVKDMAEVLRYEERLDFARRGRSRVAPPLDQAGPSLEQRLVAGTLRRQSITAAASPLKGGGRRASRAQACPPPDDDEHGSAPATVYNATDFTI
jgi:hypothetical protein